MAQLALSLALPRDEVTVPVARHIASKAMAELGVDRESVTDIEVALTEACTNVIKHSGPGDEYEVNFSLDQDRCVIRVLDRGRGFDSSSVIDQADLSAEGGRGVALMRALVDNVHFESRPQHGTTVHLEKVLDLADASVIRRLDGRTAGKTPPWRTVSWKITWSGSSFRWWSWSSSASGPRSRVAATRQFGSSTRSTPCTRIWRTLPLGWWSRSHRPASPYPPPGPERTRCVGPR